MKISAALVPFALLGFAFSSEVTPVQKVIQLLDGMRAKGGKERVEEQVQFAAFTQFCDDTKVEKKRHISEAEDKIDMLKARIEKHQANVARLTTEIAEHDADISAWTTDRRAATDVRSLEKADYVALHQDYSESVDALKRAIKVLKEQAHDRPQPASFTQLRSLQSLSLIPQDAKDKLDLFFSQTGSEGGRNGGKSGKSGTWEPPAAFGYEFQSHGVIEMLGKLLDKFVAERIELEKDEMNRVHAYDMLMQDTEMNLKNSNQERSEKLVTKTGLLEQISKAKADIAETEIVKKADQKYLADVTATCSRKAGAFESRQKLRAEEIDAIRKAIDILKSESVTGHADQYLPQFVQKSTSLAQLRASSSEKNSQQLVVEFLLDKGQSLNSRVLSALATRIQADPFVKVKKLIQDLITRLMEEADGEADHKGWCDAELSTNEQTRKEKTANVEMLHAEIDQLEASILKLTEEISDLQQAVADLDEQMTKAVIMRQNEHKTNTETIKDADEAQKAVAQALAVLKEFYEKAGEATALIQQRPPIPEIFETSYKGMQEENGGVVGMLEVIATDFARLETDTKAAEEIAQREHDTFMTDNKADKAAAERSIERKQIKQQDEEQEATTKSEDLAGTQDELDAALTYFDKLKPTCIERKAGGGCDDPSKEEERIQRRKDEIASLQEALTILGAT